MNHKKTMTLCGVLCLLSWGVSVSDDISQKTSENQIDVEHGQFTKQDSIALDKHRNKPAREKDFVIHPNGTVYDKRTKLTWMRCSIGQFYENNTCVGEPLGMHWDVATNYHRQLYLMKSKCPENCHESLKGKTLEQLVKEGVGFDFAGHTDWRLPNRWELETLVHCSSGVQGDRLPENRDQFMSAECGELFKKPTILGAVFPNTPDDLYWSSSMPDVRSPEHNKRYAWVINFAYGSTNGYSDLKANEYFVRLVR